MIIAYTIINNHLEKKELVAQDPIPSGTIWLDLLEPTVAEEKAIEAALKINAPTREEMDRIEVMSPFYKEGDAYYMTVTVLHKQGSGYSDSTPITFILTQGYLVTLRYTRPRSFSNFASRAMRGPAEWSSPDMVLEGLVEALVHRIADVLEKVGNELDDLLKNIFEKPITEDLKFRRKNSSEYYSHIIKRIGHTGNLISKNRESLESINRLLIFFSQIENSKYMSKREHRLKFRNISREVHSLSEYANFLSQRNGFLLDATLGMLGVEQNMIIKIFTVAAVAFMPPTLIASVYGMNFINMPELEWMWGYPLALLIILVSALLPYYFFKRKGWL